MANLVDERPREAKASADRGGDQRIAKTEPVQHMQRFKNDAHAARPVMPGTLL